MWMRLRLRQAGQRSLGGMKDVVVWLRALQSVGGGGDAVLAVRLILPATPRCEKAMTRLERRWGGEDLATEEADR